ncbi:NADH-quinone oxidoreductase subunit N [bacterium]|nr:NADH-quinone oxidoreductase subunit N [bacterium]
MSNLHSIKYFIPELIILATVLIGIIADLFYSKKKSYLTGNWILGGLILALISILLHNLQNVTTLFTDMVALDPFAVFFKLIILIATIFVVLISRYNKEFTDYRVGEYYVLLAIMVFGLFLMVSAVDLIMIYLAIETVSIMSFILAGYLKSERRSNESALKYVIYGAFSSGLMLFGMSILFGLTGVTKICLIGNNLMALEGGANFALMISFVLILAGFAYKISVVPFHFWTPDVYEGAPTTITAFLSVAPKAAGFAVVIRFFHIVFGDSVALQAGTWLTQTEIPWAQILALLAVITMTLGNVVAIQQDNIKRMLAYSSIAHAGYMLMVLPVLSSDSIYAIMLYLFIYIFMNLGAFFTVIAVKNITGGETFTDFMGLGWKMPLVGFVMTVFMFSLTGLPPTAGFIGKFYLFASLIKGGSQFYWIAFVGVINSVISLYYYMRVVKVMYFDGEPQKTISNPILPVTLILLVLATFIIIFGIYWTPLADCVRNSLIFYIGGL